MGGRIQTRIRNPHLLASNQLHPNFPKALYPDSPFLLPVDISSLARLLQMASDGLHPAVSLAKEVKELAEEHCQFLSHEADWISEKFGLTEDETDLYYSGLVTPPNLILAVQLLRTLPSDEILELLIPDLPALQLYTARHLKPASRLLNLLSPDPMVSAKPIYAHCQLEVYSDNFWFLTGLEASKILFFNLAGLFQEPAGI